MAKLKTLAFHDLTAVYGGRTVLDHVSGSVRQKEILAVTGCSGCGKTTLLNLASGAARHQPDGNIAIDGGAVFDRDLYYAVCGEPLMAGLSVRDNLRMVRTAYRNEAGDIDGVLKRLGIGHCGGNYPGRLSSGEYKRALLACALISGAPFLLLDEPTSNPDPVSGRAIADCLKWAAGSDRRGIVVATHDPDIAAVADSELKLGKTT